MKLKFGHRGKWELGEYRCDSIKEVNHIIQQTLNQRGERWYYSNINFSKEENWMEIDYGSWVLFFRIEDLTEENWNEFFGNDNIHQPHKIHKIGIPIKETEYGRKQK